jgi:hypothetical protein
MGPAEPVVPAATHDPAAFGEHRADHRVRGNAATCAGSQLQRFGHECFFFQPPIIEARPKLSRNHDTPKPEIEPQMNADGQIEFLNLESPVPRFDF